MQRIGVFVCHCGTNIAATVDVKKVVDVISKEPGVVHAEDYQYMCSETGQQKVIDAIQNEHLTGVVERSLENARRAKAKEDWEECEKYYTRR